ncbi:phospholipase B-like 1 isoform X2 [Mizuhopecten yessoensis]|uniref:phospholipase B-like 1 isoform X2 n=1 Tax=Mizuhopecten yessoensis TaxID=6573 RepID=UPI000B45DDA9|nr:phospholipase B-like 1 isoform X2 [Mizuhopecten yessoensis]
MGHVLLALTAIAVITQCVTSASYENGCVYCKGKHCQYKASVMAGDCTALGSYNDTLLETGWGILDISAGYGKVKFTDQELMYGTGFMEGVLTANKKSGAYITKLQTFLSDQDVWLRQMVENNQADPVWRHVGLVIDQYDGLIDGYKSVAPDNQQLEVFAFQVLNGAGDLIDLQHALDPKSIPDWKKMSHKEAKLYIQRHGFCSALIKVLGAYENVFMSHSSWFMYQFTMRIFKHWDINVQDSATAARQISFSSYPGFLESLDDFYLLGSKMVLLQTTNNVFNASLYQTVQPKSLLAWQRVRVASMMAHTGREWADIFSKYNSGTYNNQYMIVDLKQIELGKTINDNALWVVEQIPTRVTSGDQTPILRTGYWPSYNVPFYEDIYNMSGYPDFVAQHGTDNSYQLAPRAKIFRRDEGKVLDLQSMKHIMRYNDYQHDSYSEGDACNAICCRGDLKNESSSASGCYDTKVSDYHMAQNFVADIVNGPTLGTGLPPFQWTNQFKDSHVGLPLVYSFDFLRTSPRWRAPFV